MSEPSNAELEAAAREFLSALLPRVAPTAQAEIQQRGKALDVHLRGATAFVGFEANAIQSLEHLIDLSLRRSLRTDARVRVDIDDFRQRRVDELRQLAQEMANQALTQRRRVNMEPMSAWERKAVHEALEGFKGVKTFSRGNVERHLVIDPLPKDKKKG